MAYAGYYRDIGYGYSNLGYGGYYGNSYGYKILRPIRSGLIYGGYYGNRGYYPSYGYSSYLSGY